MAEQSLEELSLQLKNEDVELRRKAAQALGKLRSEASPAVDGLIEALKDENVNVRLDALQALGKTKVKSKEVVEALNQALSDQNQYVRLIAAVYLYHDDPGNKLAEDIRLQYQKQILEQHQHINERAKVFEELKKALNDPELDMDSVLARYSDEIEYINKSVLAPLIRNLSDKDTKLRQSVASYLGKYPGQLGPIAKPAIEPLIQALTADSDKEVRRNAAYSLGQIGESSSIVINSLTQTMSDEEVDVQEAARASLIILKQQNNH